MQYLIIFAFIHVAIGTRDEFTCILNTDTNVCWFKNLARNESDPNFVAKSDVSAAEVTKVYLGGGHGSHLYTLTQDICLAFENLQDFNGQLLYLHELESGVFSKCLELEVVNLEVNRLRSLDVNLFKNNPKLKKIQLADNLLETIDMKIFEGLSQLEVLDLNKNLLKIFPVQEMPKLPLLTWLTLQNNKLTDLDVHKLHEKCPKMADNGAHLRLCPGNNFAKTSEPMFKC